MEQYQQPGELRDQVVNINRVTKVVKGGKNFSFAALVVVGDGNGWAGFGIGKAREVPSAIAKGVDRAKRNLQRIPMRGSTIPHQITGRFGAGAVLLKPCLGRYRRHRRWRRPCGPRGGGCPGHSDEVSRHKKPLQRRPRNV